MPTVRDFLDLREHVVEVFRPFEQAETAGVHVREVQHRQDAFRVLDEGEEFVQAADDLGAAARLDAQAGADLGLLVGVADEPQVLRNPVHRLFRLELPEHAEVRDDDRRAHRGREHPAPDHALHALLGQPVRIREVHIVWRVQRKLDVHFSGEVS